MTAGKKKIVRIDALLGEMFENRNWRQNLARNRVFDFWAEAVGKDIAAHARPRLVRGKVLWLDVTDSIWMQQLHFQKEDLRRVINERIPGEDGIDDIRFNLVANLPLSPPAKKIDREPGPPPRLPPDSGKLAEFEKLLATIGDEGARNSFRTLWLVGQGRK
ncbi:MAG: DUF721 domain-containing protein [Desulfurivibrionaceae bacterium]|nr:DUF721 domain-containing protein [Desulfobulbales bacterium]MDT8335107.1 DUF721 domain-containing protein [Desulfurivibrionaceae bacterium]